MRRREFIAGIGAAVALPLAARAQQPDKVARVGYLSFVSTARSQREDGAFKEGLVARGQARRRVDVSKSSPSENVSCH
jgi:hypothetical protein